MQLDISGALSFVHSFSCCGRCSVVSVQQNLLCKTLFMNSSDPHDSNSQTYDMSVRVSHACLLKVITALYACSTTRLQAT